ncbi:MAG: outer membrane beta-barrel protein [Alphaproteobacteria bacterium]
MKRVLGATVGLLAASATAMAADLPVKAPMVAPIMAPAFSWSGCYIGGNIGGKWAQSDGSVTIAAAGTGAAATPASAVAFGRGDSSSFMGGGQIGCQIQTGNWVLGLEGDADWHRLSFSRTLVGGAALPILFVAGDVFDLRSDWQASARGRIGYAWDRWMIYATGGAAFTNVNVGTNFIAIGPFPATVVSDSKTLVGWTVGGGMEYAITNNWIAGIEGRYSNYGTTNFNAGQLSTFGPLAGGTFTLAAANQSIKLETFEVMGRLSYKFDWGGPVVARY